MNIDEKIILLGDSFRGLWRNCYQFNEEGKLMYGKGWFLTFIYNEQYVETPECATANKALDFAIDKLHALKS